jgi:hypothetical protein
MLRVVASRSLAQFTASGMRYMGTEKVVTALDIEVSKL